MPDTGTESSRARTEYRKYLQPDVVARLANMELVARLVVEGFITGLHKSPFHGFSVEFAEHRQYMPGDEIRHVDWKIYGKTDRYYIMQYEEEPNLKSYIIQQVDDILLGEPVDETGICIVCRGCACQLNGAAARRCWPDHLR